MPNKNIKNPEKPSKKMGATAIQEQCSLVAVYYAVAQGASLNLPGKSIASNKAQVELDNTLKEVHKKPIPKDWYDTFIETAKVVCGYIGHRIGSKNNSYKFGWYDGIPNGVPRAKVTTVIPDIWDKFGNDVWKLFGGYGQKDSWNTADIFLVKNGQGERMLASIKELKKTFENTDPEVLVGSVNTLMTDYFKSGKVLPISLKAKTKGVSMRFKQTNIHEWDQSGTVNIQTANFAQGAYGVGPAMFFDVSTRKNQLGFGNTLQNAGNSLQYAAEFRVGDYHTKYMVEVRASGDGIKAEAKEIVQTDKGTERRSNAQVGSVPIDVFVSMMSQFVDIEANVPRKNTSLNTPSYINFWTRELDKVIRSKAIPYSFGNLSIEGGEVYGTGKTKEFITKLFELDEMAMENPNKLKAQFNVQSVREYGPLLRMKLKQLRVIRAFQIAKSRKKINKLFIEMFYRAAKQNVDDGDLCGPFLKIY